MHKICIPVINNTIIKLIQRIVYYISNKPREHHILNNLQLLNLNRIIKFQQRGKKFELILSGIIAFLNELYNFVRKTLKANKDRKRERENRMKERKMYNKIRDSRLG